MSRKILIDDDATQYENINHRLRRLEQGILLALQRPSVRVTNTGTPTIPAGLSAVPFNSVRHDVGTVGMWSSANPTRLTINVSGTYIFGGSLRLSTAPSGNWAIAVRRNSTNRLMVDTPLEAGVLGGSTAGQWRFTQGDYIEFTAFLSGGSGIAVAADANHDRQIEFWANMLST